VITGRNEYGGLKRILIKMDIMDEYDVNPFYEANYCAVFGYKNVRWTSVEADEEFEELSPEELEVMAGVYGSEYDQWYDKKLSTVVGNILLGEEDES